MTDSAQTYQEHQDQLKTEQAGMTKEDIMEQLPAEYKIDLDNLPKQTHRWVDRGAKLSCEGGNHPHHSHFKVGKQ